MNPSVLLRRYVISVVGLMVSLEAGSARMAPTGQDNAFEHLNEVMDRFNRTVDVYTDLGAAGNHFAARCAMGSYGATSIDEGWTEDCHAGATCIKNQFRATGDIWAGWYFDNGILNAAQTQPACNWGNYPAAGIDLSGASKLTFWARGETGGERIELLAGGIGRDPFRGTPTQPYPDSFARVPPAPQMFTLTPEWQKYEIPLAGLDLSYVVGGFAWVANARNNPSGAVFFLDDIQYQKARPDDLRFLVSYETLPEPSAGTPDAASFDRIFRNVAFAYDNVVVLLAYLARLTDPSSTMDDGTRQDMRRRATLLADAFVYAQDHDRFYTDGRLRNAYQGGDLILPPGWRPNNRTATARMPGWWQDGQWLEDAAHVGSDTGNMGWVMLGLLQAHKVLENDAYLQAALRLGRWVAAHTRSNAGVGGFTGGYEGWEPSPTRRTWKSTEHNIDLYVAFRRLAELTYGTERESWLMLSSHARGFVTRMWQACPGSENHFATGTFIGEISGAEEFNCSFFPEDVNTWAVMTLGTYKESVEWVETHALASEDCFGETPPAQGIDFNDDRDGIWWEGTAHTVIAERMVERHDQADAFLDNLRKAQTRAPNANGKGIVATCHDGVSTGLEWFKLNNRLHIAATSWFAMAELSHNPYWGIGTSERPPESGPIAVITSISPNAANNGDVISNVTVAGTDLNGATFTFLAADNAEGHISVDSALVDESGTSATLSITVAPNARGLFVLVAINSGGTSETRPADANTFSVDYTWLVAHQPLIADIVSIGEKDRYVFRLSAVTRVVLQATGGVIQPCLRLLPEGSAPSVTGTTFHCGVSYNPVARLDLVLPAGSYLVEVQDANNDQIGSYTLIYEPIVVSTAVSLVSHEAVTGTINPKGDLNLYTIELATATRVVLQATGGVIQPCLWLLTPAGAPSVPGRTLHCGVSYNPVARLDLVLPAGSYLMEVQDANNDQIGSYTLIYEPIVASTAFPLSAHDPITHPIAAKGDLNLNTFELTTPTRVVLQATGVGIQPCLWLLTPASGPIVSGTTLHCGVSYNPVARLDLVLPAGSYLVEVQDANNDQIGSYTLIYEPIVASTAVSLVSHEAVTGTINPKGDLNLYTIELATATRVVLQATGGVMQPCLWLLTPAGAPSVPGRTLHCGVSYNPVARLDLVLPAGSYLVEVQDANNDQTGSYALIYEPVVPSTAVSLMSHEAVTGTINPKGDLNLYTIELATATRVVLQATGSAMQPCLWLLTPAGGSMVSGTTLHCGVSYNPVARLDLVLPAGSYLVEVQDANNDQIGSYTLVYAPGEMTMATGWSERAAEAVSYVRSMRTAAAPARHDVPRLSRERSR